MNNNLTKMTEDEILSVLSVKSMWNFINTEALHRTPDGKITTGLTIINGSKLAYDQFDTKDRKIKILLIPIVADDIRFSILFVTNKKEEILIENVTNASDTQEIINFLIEKKILNYYPL